jgi:hypothetical protein
MADDLVFQHCRGDLIRKIPGEIAMSSTTSNNASFSSSVSSDGLTVLGHSGGDKSISRRSRQIRAWVALIVASALSLEAESSVALPPKDPWSDYHIIMWQPQNAAQYAALKQIGVDTGMAIWRDDGTKDFAEIVAPFRDAGIGWYAENIATDFYSAYHRWTAGKAVNWRFDEVKRRYWKNPQDTSVFIREPSLSDPVWLDRIRDRLSRVVRAAIPYRALYYSLGDEPGIADLAAYWDFDLSAPSMAAMRTWLKEQYLPR